MGEVVLARTLPTLHPPSPPTVHQLLQPALEELSTNLTNFFIPFSSAHAAVVS